MNKIISTMASVVFLMALFGIVVVASATEKGRLLEFSQLANSQAVWQVIWLLVALAAGVCALCVDYHLYKRPEVMAFIYLATVVMLAMVFLPVVGYGAKGSQRWINLGFCKMQPSEFAKLAAVVLVCAWVDRVGVHIQRFKEGILYPGAALVLLAFLILFEKDVGATVVLVISCGAILFVAGAKLRHLAPVIFAALAILVVVVLTSPALKTRVAAFINSKCGTEITFNAEDKEEARRQELIKRDHVEQALEAFRNGGFWGVGYMNSEKKRFYLREAHTDFIPAIVGEEFGFVGGVLLLLGYGAILVCGMFIAVRAKDRLGRNLAFGMTFLLVFQSAFNLGVVTDMLPTKGIALPFISYGGTSLLASMIAVGVILNVGHQTQAKLSDDTNVFRDAIKI